jgi:hypothetical protein
MPIAQEIATLSFPTRSSPVIAHRRRRKLPQQELHARDNIR